MHSTDERSKQLISISTWSILKVILLILGLGLLWLIRDILGVVFVSLLLAALIDPFADWLARHRIPRALAVFCVYAVLAVIAIGIVVVMVPVLFQQIQQLLENFSQIYGQFGDAVIRFQNFSSQYGFDSDVHNSIVGVQDQIGSSVSTVFSKISGLVGGLVGLVLVLVLTFYMVVEEQHTRTFFKNLAPVEYQPFLIGLFTKMQKKIGAWLRGQLLLGLVVGTAVYVGLLFLHVPYALVLGILSGLFEIIPYAGPLFAIIPALIIGFSVSPVTGFSVLILYVVIQQIENHLLVPKIMQRVTGLNPIVSIVALLIGVKLGGMVGALLAIPVATMASVILEEVFAEYRTDA